MITASRGGRSAKAIGGWKNLLGPKFCVNDTLLLHTGSVNIRLPSISISRLEWPTHVTLKPLAGGVLYIDTSVLNGPKVCFGVPSALLFKYSFNIGIILSNP